MPTSSQDQKFRDFLKEEVADNGMSTTSLDSIISWMQSNLEPDDVFTDKDLENWAESNDYKKED